MEYNEELETVINNEYDYSNIIATADNISHLVQYCEQLYDQLMKLIQEDEIKNEKFKYEFKNYNYNKHFGMCFEIKIRGKSYNVIECKSYNAYLEAVNSGQLKEVSSFEIDLKLNYRRGKKDNLKDYENSFKLIFKPYEIKFKRQSNHNESDINQIEIAICDILNKFPVANTIFCTK